MKTGIVFFLSLCCLFALPDSTCSNSPCSTFSRTSSLELNSLPQIEYVLQSASSQWQAGRNEFACYYFIVSWGCGTGCQMNAVFDQKTGAFIDTFNTTNGCVYEKSGDYITVNADPIWNTPKRCLRVLEGEITEVTCP
jgi:hypothetical protein